MTTEPTKSNRNKAFVATVAVAVAVLLVSAIFAYSYFGAATPAPSSQQPASLQQRPVPVPEVKQPEPAQDQQKVPQQQQSRAEQQQNVAPPQPQQAEANKSTVMLPVFDKPNTSTIDNDIEFTVKLNTTLLERGQTILAEITARNLLPKVVYVPAESNWAPGITRPLCYGWASVGIFQGYYTKSNISSAIPLRMAKPNLLALMCPAPDVYKDLYVERAQDGAIKTVYLVLQPRGEKGGFFSASGYYVKSARDPVKSVRKCAEIACDEHGQPYDFVPFPNGVYTMAAGTGWGQILFLYFTVK